MKQARLSIVIEGRPYSFKEIPSHLRERYAEALADDNRNGIPDSLEQYIDIDGADGTEIVMRLNSGELDDDAPGDTYRNHFRDLMSTLVEQGDEDDIFSLFSNLETTPVFHVEFDVAMLPAEIRKELVNRNGMRRSRLREAKVSADFESERGWKVRIGEQKFPPGTSIHAFIVNEVDRIESGKKSILSSIGLPGLAEEGLSAQSDVDKNGAPDIVTYHSVSETEVATQVNRHRSASRPATHSSADLERHIREQLGERRRGAFGVLFLLLIIAAVAVLGFWYLFVLLPGNV